MKGKDLSLTPQQIFPIYHTKYLQEVESEPQFSKESSMLTLSQQRAKNHTSTLIEIASDNVQVIFNYEDQRRECESSFKLKRSKLYHAVATKITQFVLMLKLKKGGREKTFHTCNRIIKTRQNGLGCQN